MTQTEEIKAFARYQAAVAQARIQTDEDYEPSPETFALSGETTSSLGQRRRLLAFAGEYVKEVSASNVQSVTWIHTASEASGTSVSLDAIADTQKYLVLFIHEITELTTLAAVVDRARSEGLQEIADRLVELGRQHYGEDELPLHARSAMHFLKYFLLRRQKTRPLMTVTPEGELDATWEGPDRQNQVMRFFPDGSVWVAYKLSRGRGSFETTTTDFLDPEFHYKVPEWA